MYKYKINDENKVISYKRTWRSTNKVMLEILAARYISIHIKPYTK